MDTTTDHFTPLALRVRGKNMVSGYRSLAESLVEFSELGELPIHLERLDEGGGIETTMVSNDAQYHQSCRLKYNNTMLQRAQKRALKTDDDSPDACK